MTTNGKAGPILYRVPLHLAPQPEGGFTVTSPVIPELLTEGDTVDEALANARDAMTAVLEIYEEDGRSLPASVIEHVSEDDPVVAEALVFST
jgi:antitoxin HicB